MTVTSPAETIPTPVADEGRPGQEPVSATRATEEVTLVDEELLVEDVSIDGMCGVY